MLTHFLKIAPENKLDVIVAGKRKQELQFLVPVKYVAFTKISTFANILLKKLQKKEKKYLKFECDITGSILLLLP